VQIPNESDTDTGYTAATEDDSVLKVGNNSIRFAFVGFVLFRFHFVDFVSFRFVFVDFVSFRFVSFLFRFALYRCTRILKTK
jgi:hypothetical protein